MNKVDERPVARGRPRTFDRAAALHVALALFWRHGFARTSVAMLTQAMGIGPPSFYAAFGDKASLFAAAVDHYRSNREAAIRGALDLTPVQAAIEALFRSSVMSMTDPQQPSGCMFVQADLSGCDTDPPLDVLAEAREDLFQAVLDRLRRGVADGDLSAGCDVVPIARFCVTVIHGLSIQARDRVPRADLLAMTKVVIAAIRRAGDEAEAVRRMPPPPPSSRPAPRDGRQSGRPGGPPSG